MKNNDEMKKLHWGCGQFTTTGWTNVDIKKFPGIDYACDIREGLPMKDNTFDYIVTQHAINDMPVYDIFKSLKELYRVLKPGGHLRLSVADFDIAIKAYQEKDLEFFNTIPDNMAKSLGGKFIAWSSWYMDRIPLTYDYIYELLENEGFKNITRCNFNETKSHFEDITSLDNRPKQSVYVEAVK